MTRRSYGQFCPIACALDVIGDRWTLLIVRELLLGPRRFTDLQGVLPGIGTSLLADRLKQMEQAGVIQRERLAPPAGAAAYRLTERGEGLGPVVLALATWGRGLLGTPPPDEPFRPELLGLYLAASAGAIAPAGTRETYEVRIDDTAMHFAVDGGHARARVGRAPERADLVLRMDRATFVDLALGDAELPALVNAGRVTATTTAPGTAASTAASTAAGGGTGDRPLVARAARLFSSPDNQPSGKD
jgi:DNA-binding HxlR family transcriptional regulator